MSTGHTACEGWGCKTCLPAAEQLQALGGEQGLDATEHELARVQRELHEAKQAVGEGWLIGGVSLAEAIARKMSRLEESIGDSIKGARREQLRRELLETKQEFEAAEREACAVAALGDVERFTGLLSDWREGYVRGRKDAADAIRARGSAS